MCEFPASSESNLFLCLYWVHSESVRLAKKRVPEGIVRPVLGIDRVPLRVVYRQYEVTRIAYARLVLFSICNFLGCFLRLLFFVAVFLLWRRVGSCILAAAGGLFIRLLRSGPSGPPFPALYKEAARPISSHDGGEFIHSPRFVVLGTFTTVGLHDYLHAGLIEC